MTKVYITVIYISHAALQSSEQSNYLASNEQKPNILS